MNNMSEANIGFDEIVKSALKAETLEEYNSRKMVPDFDVESIIKESYATSNYIPIMDYISKKMDKENQKEEQVLLTEKSFSEELKLFLKRTVATLRHPAKALSLESKILCAKLLNKSDKMRNVYNKLSYPKRLYKGIKHWVSGYLLYKKLGPSGKYLRRHHYEDIIYLKYDFVGTLPCSHSEAVIEISHLTEKEYNEFLDVLRACRLLKWKTYYSVHFDYCDGWCWKIIIGFADGSSSLITGDMKEPEELRILTKYLSEKCDLKCQAGGFIS